jgi:hypothetical protein
MTGFASQSGGFHFNPSGDLATLEHTNGTPMRLPFTIGSWLALMLLNCHFLKLSAQSTSDAWDVSNGTTILSHSAVATYFLDPSKPFDPRDMFGGRFREYQHEEGNFIFADGLPTNFVYFVEWRTAEPVKIRSIALWAAADQCRGIASFRLLAKSSDSPLDWKTLYQENLQKLYSFIDGTENLVVHTDVLPVTAQDFRMELTRHPSGCVGGGDGPRLIELDGFTQAKGSRLTLDVSEVTLSWPSVLGVRYQLEFKEDKPDSAWAALGDPFVGTGSTLRFSVPVDQGQTRRLFRIQVLD